MKTKTSEALQVVSRRLEALEKTTGEINETIAKSWGEIAKAIVEIRDLDIKEIKDRVTELGDRLKEFGGEITAEMHSVKEYSKIEKAIVEEMEGRIEAGLQARFLTLHDMVKRLNDHLAFNAAIAGRKIVRNDRGEYLRKEEKKRRTHGKPR